MLSRRMAWPLRTAAACLAVAIGAGHVEAASLKDPLPPARAAKAPLPWYGFYAGAHIGYAWTDTDFQTPAICFEDHDPSGPLLGMQIGMNFQRGAGVFGIEADYSRLDVDDRGSIADGSHAMAVSTSFDDLMSLRARIGVASGPVHTYVTGGFAWMTSRVGISVTDAGITSQMSKKSTDSGLAFGAGLEWRTSQKVSFRTEVLHYLFDKSYEVGGTKVETDPSMTVLRLGLNLHF